MASWSKWLAGYLLGKAGLNPERSGVSFGSAILSSTLLRLGGARVGNGVKVSLSCRVFAPESIEIGDGSEILRNSTVDGCPLGHGSIVIGRHCRLKENVWLAAYGGRIKIGDRVLIGRNAVLHGHGGIEVGADTMLGPACMIFSSDHITAVGGIFRDLGQTNRSVSVGRNVWFGAGVIVTSGSSVDDDVVVAAGSVVRGHLKSGRIYGGIPARHIKDLNRRPVT